MICNRQFSLPYSGSFHGHVIPARLMETCGTKAKGSSIFPREPGSACTEQCMPLPKKIHNTVLLGFRGVAQANRGFHDHARTRTLLAGCGRKNST